MSIKPPPAREARAPKPLTVREARFVEQYRLHGNAARAAREAGYAAHQATAIGYNVLRKPKIIAALRGHGIEIVPVRKKPGAPKTYARSYKRFGLTLLQERFVHQYLIDGNATQAAIRAGLSGNPARAGSTLLHHREVAKAIERERAAMAARLDITADRVKNELAAIAFANIADVAEWGADGVTLKEKKTLPRADQAAIAELSSSRIEKTGAAKAHVKMHSKQQALDALAKHLGLYGRGVRTIAPAVDEEAERREANAILRERLMKIVERGKK
jgi:phage terminase small subunit